MIFIKKILNKSCI